MEKSKVSKMINVIGKSIKKNKKEIIVVCITGIVLFTTACILNSNNQ